jgi:hypothetical protein
MTDKPDQPAPPPEPTAAIADDPGGQVTLDGTTYHISRTAFRSHYQVMTVDGKLLGLIEMVEAKNGQTFTARPATGAGMTQSLMIKIATSASSAGIIK